MPVIVPLCMMIWSNTLVYPCEYVDFVLFYHFTLWMYFQCALCCLMFIYMSQIQVQLMQRLDQGNKYVCMYVYSKSYVSKVNFEYFSRPPNTTYLQQARMTCCANRHIAHYFIVVPKYYCILTPMVSQISFDYFTTNFKSSAFSRKCFRLNLYR